MCGIFMKIYFWRRNSYYWLTTPLLIVYICQHASVSWLYYISKLVELSETVSLLCMVSTFKHTSRHTQKMSRMNSFLPHLFLISHTTSIFKVSNIRNGKLFLNTIKAHYLNNQFQMKQMWYILFEILITKFEFLTQFNGTKYGNTEIEYI